MSPQENTIFGWQRDNERNVLKMDNKYAFQTEMIINKDMSGEVIERKVLKFRAALRTSKLESF